jgi:hypothetical protein
MSSREEYGNRVEEVSLFLDHSSLAMTSVYLRRLEGQEHRGWGRVAEAIGIVAGTNSVWPLPEPAVRRQET